MTIWQSIDRKLDIEATAAHRGNNAFKGVLHFLENCEDGSTFACTQVIPILRTNRFDALVDCYEELQKLALTHSVIAA